MYNYNIKILYIIFSMSDFWNNISRYPRFFISSVAGLILIIITPFKNLFKVQKFRIFLIVFLLLFIFTLYTIITNMIGL